MNSFRTPKRIYTQKALEAWFERLSSDWEHFFGESVLKDARELYLQGEVRELELSLGEAIIHCRRGKLDLYSMVEWENGRPDVRTSTKDRHLGNSLAIAGLYEIEELLGDEIPPVPAEIPTDEGTPSTRSIEPPLPPSDSREMPRGLVLIFESTEQGLKFDAHWRKAGEKNCPALPRHKKRVGNLNSVEREKLIRLTGLARRSGFEFSSRNRNYLLRDTARISAFLRSDLPIWKRHFSVEKSQDVDRLLKGVQTVNVEAEAEEGKGGFSLRWKLNLGSLYLNDSQTEALLRRGGGGAMILPRLGMVRIDRKQAPAIENWRSLVHQQQNGGLPNYMIFSIFGENELPVTLSDSLNKWRDSVLKPGSSLNGLPTVLRPYQRRGVRWLSNLCDNGCHALLADEMGLGKTIQLAALIASRPIPGKSHLVVCPASVVPVWKNELARFFPELRVETLRTGHNFVDKPEPAVWLTSYTQLRRQKHLLAQSDFGYAVLDEGQLIKNPDTKVSLACMGIQALHRFVLTGTPLENKHLDLWTLFRFLMPGLLGDRRGFSEGFEKEGVEFLEKLNRQISPFVLRRTKRNVVQELPAKVEIELVCPLSGLQKQEYTKLVEEGLGSLGDDLAQIKSERTMNLFTLLTRLRQTCCDPDLLPWVSAELSQSGKMKTLLTKVSEAINNGHKIVIFSQFVSLLSRVREGLEGHFPGISIYQLTGKTVDREKPVSEFQASTGASVILISLRAGGTGITLHAADYVFLLDPWWNPAVEEQAIDRVHRIGQEKTVFVYRMTTEGTIEERIEELKTGKRELFNQIVGGLKDVSQLQNHFQSLGELISLTPGNGSGIKKTTV